MLKSHTLRNILCGLAALLLVLCVTLPVHAEASGDGEGGTVSVLSLPGPVLSNITDYYTYTSTTVNGVSGYQVGLVSAFKTAVNKASGGSFKDSSGNTWVTGDPLPNPGSTYNGVPVLSMENMFESMSAMTSLDLSLWDTSNVMSTSYMFLRCSGLKSLEMTGFNTSSVTNMSFMFFNCSSLTSLDVTGFDTSNAVSMYCMFSGCSKLMSLDVTGFNTSKVTDMGSMFSGCSGLTSIDVSGFDTSKVSSMNNMFNRCSGLTVFDLSSFDMTKVTGTYGMLSGAAALKGYYARTVADAQKLNSSVGKPVALVFKAISVTDYYTYTLLDGGSGYRVGLAPDFKAAVNKASGGSFTDSNGYTWVTGDPLPNPGSTYNGLPVRSMENMFSSMSAMSSLDLSYYNPSSITNMSAMFSGCSGLTRLDLLLWDTSNVTNMSAMFSGCSGLTRLDLRDFNTRSVVNTSSMFQHCSMFVVFDLSSFDMTHVTDASAMFDGAAAAAVGYARTATDAQKLNASAGKPAALVFKAISVTDYYTYTPWDSGPGYQVGLASAFKTEVNKASGGSFTDSNGNTWVTGDSLPNPGRIYDGLPVRSMASMFKLMGAMTSLDLSLWDTSKVANMNEMFYYCSNLTSLDVTGFDTSSVTIMSYMFYMCSGLTSIDVSGFDTSSVTSMSGMFAYCSGLTSLDVSGFDTSKVTNMNSMFSYCPRLTSLNLSSFNTSMVTNMNSMFSYCPRLTSLNLSNFNTSRVMYMSSMFSDCSQITVLDLSSFDTTNVTDMTDMFSGATAAKVGYARTSADAQKLNASSNKPAALVFKAISVTDYYTYTLLDGGSGYQVGLAPDFKAAVNKASGGSFTDSNGYIWVTGDPLPNPGSIYNGLPVLSMKSIFSSMSAMTSLDLTGWDTSSVTDMSSMFSVCSGLTSLDLTGVNSSSVANMSSMFSGCSQISVLDLSGFDTTNVTSMFDMFNGTTAAKVGYARTSADAQKLNASSNKPATLVFKAISVTDYYVYTLSNDRSSYIVSLATAFKTEVNKASGGSFTDSNGNTWVTGDPLPNPGSAYNGLPVRSMASMFSSMSAMTSLDVSLWDTSSVTSMSYMFQDCSGLTSLDVTGFNTSKVTDMSSMFSGCSGLPSIDVTGFDTSKVTSMSYMFYGCPGLTSLDVSLWDTSSVTDMSFMFFNCSSLTSLDVTGFDTSNAVSMYCMFSGCSKLMSLDVTGFNTSKVTDMGSMFSGCSGLTSLDVTGFDTSKVTDMSSMFSGCSGLTSIDVTNFSTSSVTRMGSMFRSCSKLTSLDVTNFSTSSVTSMGSMFSGCSGITSLDVTGFDTSKVTDMSSMFQSCSQITVLDLSSFDTTKLYSSYGSDGMFSGTTATKVGYARTVADAQKFNSYKTSKPSALVFGVKISPTLTASNWVYGTSPSGWTVSGNPGYGAVTYTYFTDAACTTQTSAALSGAAAAGGQPVNAGGYYVKATVAAKNNYAAGETPTVAVTVTKAAITVTATPYNDVYDGAPHTITLAVGTANSQSAVIYYGTTDLTAANYDTLGSSTAPTCTDVGTSTVYYYITAPNHNPASGSRNVVVTPRPISVTAASASKVYDGTPLSNNTATVTGGSLVSNHSIVPSITGTITDAGSVVNTLTSVKVMNGAADASTNYAVTVVNGTLSVTPKPASTLSVALGQTSYVYDGTAKTPTVTVKDGEKTLTAGTDYSVAYSGNTNAGTATVTVSGTGNYTGTNARTFTITPKSAAALTITLSAGSYEYDGTAKTPAVTVKDGAKTLTAGTDYSVAYSGNTNAGTATVTVSGTGNYTGTNAKSFTITARPITVTADSISKVYDGTALTAATVKITSGSLASGHTLTTTTVGTITNVGSVTNTLTAVKVMSGNTDVTVNYAVTLANGTLAVTSKSVAGGNITIAAMADVTYSGSAFTPTPAVTDVARATVLIKGTDYTFSYTNNTAIGTATVTVSGIGNYTGTATATFNILEVPVSITAQPAAVSTLPGKAVTFRVTADGSNIGFQWYVRAGAGQTGTVITGATAASHTLSAAEVTTALNGKQYYCVLTNKRNSVQSSDAALTVYGTPSVPTISATSGGAALVSGAWARAQVSFTFSGSTISAGAGSVGYQYSWDNSTWTAGATLAYAAETAGKTLYVRAYNTSASTQVSSVTTFSVKYDSVAPVVSAATVSTSAWTNANVTLTITATDATSGIAQYAYGTSKTEAPTGTWQTGNAISIGTTGVYYAWVKDNAGNVVCKTDSPLQVNVDKVAPVIGLINSTSATANTQTITVSGISDTGGSGLSAYYVSTSSTAPTAGSAWVSSTAGTFTYTASANTTYHVWVRDNAGNISNVASVTVSGIVPKVTNVRLQSSATLQMQSTTQLTLVYSGTAKSVDYVSDNTAFATVNASGLVSGIEYGATKIRVKLTDYDGTVTTAVTDVTITNIPPSINMHPASVAMKIEAGPATFTVTAAGTHNRYQWYRNATSATTGGTVISAAQNASAATAALSVPITVADNGTYFYCVVSNDGNPSVASTSAQLTLAFPHTISTQPESHTVLARQTDVTFAVAATSGNPTTYTYQWYEKESESADGTAISGATQSSLTLTKAGITEARTGHLFYCVVSNGQYERTSESALLTVGPVISITAQPQDVAVKSVNAVDDVTFSVAATGAGTLSYQWYQGANKLSSSSTSFSIPASAINSNAKSLNGTSYTCKITQVYGESRYTVTTPAATLTVYYPPEIVEQPADIGTVEGEAVTFHASVAVGNPDNLTYAWYRVDEAGDVKVASTLSYAIPAEEVTPALNGSRYYLTVSNGEEYYTVRSDIVTLTVCGIPTTPTIVVTDIDGIVHGSGVWANAALNAAFGGSTVSGAGAVKYQYSTDANATWQDADSLVWTTETTQTTLYVRAVNTWASRAASPAAEYVVRYDSVAPTIGKVEVGDIDIRDGAVLIMTSLQDPEPQSGLAGYHINATGETPTSESYWYPVARNSVTHTVTKDGVWYIWLLDTAGNITTSPYECEVLGLGGGTLSTAPLIASLDTDISGYVIGKTQYLTPDRLPHSYSRYALQGASKTGLQVKVNATPRDGYYLSGYVEIMGIQYPLYWGANHASYTSKRTTALAVIEPSALVYSARNVSATIYVSEYATITDGVLANKTNTQRASMTVSADVSAPVVSISYNTFSKTCTVTAKDALAGLDTVVYQLSTDNGISYGAAKNYTAPFEVTETCLVRVTATDKLGNQTQETSDPITVSTEIGHPVTGIPKNVAAPVDESTNVYVYRSMRFNYVLVGTNKSN